MHIVTSLSVAVAMAAVPLTVHGFLAHLVYGWFNRSAEAQCRFKVNDMLKDRTDFFKIHRTYFIQTEAQLREFVGLLRPKPKNGKSAAQQREEFYSHHVHLLSPQPGTRNESENLSAQLVLLAPRTLGSPGAAFSSTVFVVVTCLQVLVHYQFRFKQP